MNILSLLNDKLTLILTVLLGVSFVVNVILNNSNNNLRKDIEVLQLNITILKQTIEKQNKAIKDIEASGSSLKKEYDKITKKYQEIKNQKTDPIKYSKDNNVSIECSKIILEKEMIKKGLDEFFKN